eukprot:403348779
MDHSPTTSYQSSAQLATSNKYSQSPNDPQNKISKLNVNLKASVVHGRYHHELRMRDQLDKVDKINEEIQRQFEVKRKSLLHEQMVQRFQDKQGTQSRNQQFKNGVTGSSSFKQSSKQGLQMSKSQNNRTGVTTRQGNQGAVESFMLKKLPDLNSQFKKSTNSLQQKSKEELSKDQFKEFYSNEYVYTQTNQPRRESLLYLIKDFADKKRLFDQGSRENRSNLQTMRQSFLLKKSSQPSTSRTPQLDNLSQNKSQLAQAKEAQEFNRFEYENIREKMQKLKGHHILLKAGLINLQWLKTKKLIHCQWINSSIYHLCIKLTGIQGNSMGIGVENKNRIFLQRVIHLIKFLQSMIFINKNKQSKWLQKREQKSQSSLLDLSQKLKDKDSKDINLIMEKLFQYWDSQNINRVTIETFQEKMIVYGLASNDVISDRLLRLIKIQNKLDENIKFIKKVHFLNLLISNRFVQPLVDLIIKKVTDARMQEEMLQKQIRSRMGDNIKVQMSQNQDKNNRQVTPSKRNKNGDQTSQSNHQGIKKTQEVSFENLSQIKEEKQKSSQSPIKKLNDVSKSNITVSDAYNQVMLFWKEIENVNNNEIKKESLMNYLKLNRVISDRSQFDEFIKQTLMQEEVGFNQPMNKQQFMTIFCKPIFNIGLMNILKLSRVQKLKGAGLLCDQDPLSCQIVNHQKDMLYSSFDQTQASQFQQNRGNSMIDLLNSNQANQETNKHSQESFSQYNLFLDRQITSKSIPKTQQRYQTQSSLMPQYSPAFTPDINAKQLISLKQP